MSIGTLPAAEPLELAEALRSGLLRVSRKLRQEAQGAGLSAQDAMLLGLVRKRPGVGVSDLAQAEQVSRPTMSAHVKRLEAAGLLVRSGHAADGRRSGLAITPAGTRQLDAIRRRRNDWLAARLARLSPQERDRLAAAVDPLLKLLSLEA
ncbi:MAG: MarR family transcriptional regulator [Phenylobacterium sp.]